MRSFFPPLVAALLLCASTAFAQISVIGNSYARSCYIEAIGDGANADPCDKSLEGEMLIGRDLAATYVNRAVVRTNAGNLAAALTDLRRAESLRPDLGEIYASRGNVLFYQNSFEEALAQYDRGIAAGMQKLHAAHYDRGLALERLGRIEEAKDAYRQSIALAPEFALAKTRLLMF
jgi:tetratricopeptide (TPR) repeat protein